MSDGPGAPVEGNRRRRDRHSRRQQATSGGGEIARGKGIRIWRYSAAKGAWAYESRRHPALSLDAKKVRLPAGLPKSEDRDFLFEDLDQVHGDPDRVTKIETQAIFAMLPNRLVPPDSDIWYYDGTDPDGAHVARIYSRSGSEDQVARRKQEQRAQVEGALPDDVLEVRCGHIVVLESDSKAIVFRKDQPPQHVLFEVDEGQVDLRAAMDAGEIDDGEMLAILATHLSRNKDELLRAFQSADDDPETAARIVLEVVKGATTSPTQGHNVLHSLPSVIDDISKIHQVVHDHIEVDDVEGATGDFGSGVSVVDQGWQAIGSVLTYMSDICKLVDVSTTSREERGDRYGANSRKRAAASVTTSFSKSNATIMKSVDAINQVATQASSISGLVAVASGFGAFASAIAAARSLHQGRKASKRLKALRGLQGLEHTDRSGREFTVRRDTAMLLAYAASKTRRKKNVEYYEAGVGALGTVGGTVLAVAAAVAAANAWNPVGWGIGIAAFALGAGMLAYEIYRKVKHEEIARRDFPRLLVARYLHLAKHQSGSRRSEHTRDRRALEIKVCESMLLAYGVEPYRCFYPREIPLLEQRIARHLKS